MVVEQGLRRWKKEEKLPLHRRFETAAEPDGDHPQDREEGVQEENGRAVQTRRNAGTHARKQRADSLLDKFGGEAGMDAAVEAFRERVLRDKLPRRFFRGADMSGSRASRKISFWRF